MDAEAYKNARDQLLANDCQELLAIEEEATAQVMKVLLEAAPAIKRDFDRASELQPYWEKYAPVQRGHKPRGEAFPWGEVGEKVVEGHLYSLLPMEFEDVQFIGVPYGHDIRFCCNKAFIHIDAKSTGPTDNPNEVVSSPNQVTGTGKLENERIVVNEQVPMQGKRVVRQFLPELAPFYILDDVVTPVLTYYLKIVYSVHGLGNQPLEYLELICVPNGLALFDGPRLLDSVNGLLIPGKDEQHVVRKRTRIRLDPLSQINQWRCQKIVYGDDGEVRVVNRMP